MERGPCRCLGKALVTVSGLHVCQLQGLQKAWEIQIVRGPELQDAAQSGGHLALREVGDPSHTHFPFGETPFLGSAASVLLLSCC